MPEARLNLGAGDDLPRPRSQVERVVDAIGAATGTRVSADPVPAHLRDASYPGARKLGHGKGYGYPHDFPDHDVEQALPAGAVRGAGYYDPSGQGGGGGAPRSSPDAGDRPCDDRSRGRPEED